MSDPSAAHAGARRPGLAGRIAGYFVNSKLTPLAVLASVLLGAFAVLMLPREEEPQIKVPMIDVFVGMPGAPASEVENRVTRPLEKLLWEIPGVAYLYSTSSPGASLVIVRYVVGTDPETALVRLNQKLSANFDRIPAGVSPPLVKPRSIDDVPVLALTLHSPRLDHLALRRLAAQLDDAIKSVPQVAETTLIGGTRRALRVQVDRTALAARGLALSQIAPALQQANRQAQAGSRPFAGTEVLLETGTFLRDAANVGAVVVGVHGGRPVYLRDVATIADAAEEPSTYVLFGSGRREEAGSPHALASSLLTSAATSDSLQPAVTLTVAKRPGANAIDVVTAVLAKVAALRGTLLPAGVGVAITRDYGHTAAEKSNELLLHMGIAVFGVAVLILLFLGWRESLVVLLAIPSTLALTLLVFYLYGYTLNRITLFALIFSIGILVDDAIVVVENIVRHVRLPGAAKKPLHQIALEAVDEVGNPTILATWAVIAAILPMAFVGGLMGPYMRPIPVGASAAMLFSLAAAFIVTPWAAVRLLRSAAGHGHEREDGATRLYRRVMGRLITDRRARLMFLAGVAVLLLAAVALVPLQLVTVKMLPFDNKSEFQVVVDLPDGTALEQTARVAADLAAAVLEDPGVTDVQSYVGLASPYNFNGLVRHYFLRRGPHLADLQVNLLPKDERREQSHDIAKRVRNRLLPMARRFDATIQVAEVPPGPPVLQTLVAEIYGPDAERRVALAQQVKSVLDTTDGVVDVDWYVESPQPKTTLVVDETRASAAGLGAADVAAAVRMASDGHRVGLLHDEAAREDVPIVLRLPRAERGSLAAIRQLRLGAQGVAIGELTREETGTEDGSIYHKNLLPVTYVTGDLAGAAESPVYAILQMNTAIARLALPEGYAFEIYNTRQPFDTTKYAMKWDGEWHITYEVFRDLGLAFAAVLVLIYILVVWWFQSFGVPITIMAAIPFSLVGILPAHAAMGAFFTATSMIGFIAGAGIVVRNSIILVDFIELRLREGMPLADAVVDAGAVRFRPMALTAAAVVAGSAVILFDPIFQGLAISLMAGEVASLLLSRVTVPVLYYVSHRPREGDRHDR